MRLDMHCSVLTAQADTIAHILDLLLKCAQLEPTLTSNSRSAPLVTKTAKSALRLQPLLLLLIAQQGTIESFMMARHTQYAYSALQVMNVQILTNFQFLVPLGLML